MIRPDDQRLLQPCLLPGERLLWTGRPGRRLVAGAADLVFLPLGLALQAYTVWTFVGGEVGDAPNVAASLLFAAIGFYAVFGRLLRDAWLRAGLLYAVSDRRVIALETRRRRRWRSVEIGALPALALDMHANGRGTLRFEAAQEVELFSAGDLEPWLPSGQLLFERIERPRFVYDLIVGEAGRRRRAPPEAAADPLFHR